GSVTAGLAIIDTMNHVKPNISTVCVGMAASMGSHILAAGTKGKRFALPNSEIMVHQPLGGVEGQTSDITIRAEWYLKLKKRLSKMMSEATGQPLARIEKDEDRDFFMSAEEAKKYGLIDKIL
ncbi:MAG: ATP-dependent Clp protease proteolytic subunit, partial [Minisyncoccia bacterium]